MSSLLRTVKSDRSESSTDSVPFLGLFVLAAALIMLMAGLCCLGRLTARTVWSAVGNLTALNVVETLEVSKGL